MSKNEIIPTRLIQRLNILLIRNEFADACGSFGVGVTRGGMKREASAVFGKVSPLAIWALPNLNSACLGGYYSLYMIKKTN